MIRLVKAELLKIRTTNAWWIFLLSVFVFTAGFLTIWLFVADNSINEAVRSAGEAYLPPPPDVGLSPAEIEQDRRDFEMRTDINRVLVSSAANIYTSGQFFALMFVMLLGILMITNEYHHQTATSTMLATPVRLKVILGKLVTAMIAAGAFWLLVTAVNAAAGAIFFNAKGYDPQFGEWPVTRAVLLNGLAFALWGVFGVGVGVLLRSQIAAVITGTAAYLVGTFLVLNIMPALYFGLGWKWVLYAMLAWPSVASLVMVSPEPPFPDSPQWWVGALILVGYGVVSGAIGTLITQRRDIS